MGSSLRTLIDPSTMDKEALIRYHQAPIKSIDGQRLNAGGYHIFSKSDGQLLTFCVQSHDNERRNYKTSLLSRENKEFCSALWKKKKEA